MHQEGLTRRGLLSARASASPAGGDCISSAVALVLPHRAAAVAAALEEMDGVTIAARADRRLVLLLEGESSGKVGALLIAIALMDGVLAANMVFEAVEPATGDA